LVYENKTINIHLGLENNNNNISPWFRKNNIRLGLENNNNIHIGLGNQ